MFVETARGYANLAHVVRMVVVEDGMMLTGITGAALGVADVTEALAAARAAGFLANRTQTEFFNPAHIAYTARGPSNRMSPRIVTHSVQRHRGGHRAADRPARLGSADGDSRCGVARSQPAPKPARPSAAQEDKTNDHLRQ